MTDYDANPFMDEGSNPFADPSVQQATRGQQRPPGLDDFNPFAETNQTATNGPQLGAKTQPAVAPPQPAVMQPTQEPPPYSANAPSAATMAATTAATDDLKRRQEELERKAAELQRKEQDLQRNLNFQTRKNNFPPLPDKCCVHPCFYQDFELDIPMEFQRIVKAVYYVWLAYVALLFINVLASLAYLITSSQFSRSNQSGTTFGLSILYFVLCTPCSFLCWYRPAYKAFRSDSSFNFFVFFFVFFMQFCWCIISALGIDGMGTVGLINGLGMVSGGSGAALAIGLVMVFIGILFAVVCLVDMVVLIKVHRIYRNTGASFAKAQQEFATGVMSNKTVQSTAANVGQSAVQGAMQNAANSSSGPDNRY